MYRLLLLITSLLIVISGFAQTPSDSIQAARKAQIEKARAAARAKAEAKAAERAKNEAAKQNAENVTDKKNSDSKAVAEADKNIKEEKSKRDRRSREEKADKSNDSKKSDAKTDSKADAKADKNVKEEKSKRERRSREEKADNANDSKKASATKETPKAEKVKKPSARERNKADTAVAKSKYGPGTFGLRGNIGATIAWNDYSDREHKIGFNRWGFVLNGGMGYRFNHIGYVGLSIDIEAIELLAFSPMLDFVVSAPTPVSPFIELTAGPYFSYDEYRKWVFQPRAGLSYRGKKNKIMRFGFGLRMYDDAFDSDSFSPQYAASYSVEF
ncbi:MAG: hypothetical protein IKK68_02135 [Paludibacteraceae bacterium]|nr:hypothetical protein [Paludibacteraceae bacterium]